MRTQIAFIAALLAALPGVAASASELPGAGANGWYAWTVGSLDAASTACCFEWTGNSATRRVCELDSTRGAYMSNGDCRSKPGAVQVYALMEDGQPVTIRTLSSECEVSAKSPIRRIGVVDAENSVQWLRNIVFSARANSAGKEAIAALGGIPDDVSIAVLVDIVSARQLAMNLREGALFWLTQSDSDTAFEFLDRLLTRQPG